MEMGTSSERQVIHSTCRSGLRGLAGAAGLAGVECPNIEPKMLDGRAAGLVPRVVEGARSNFSRTGGDVGWGNDSGRA